VALATALELAGLTWRVLDPGIQELSYWRRRLEQAVARDPRVVGVSTTFLLSEPWVRALVRLVRATLPRASIVVGGYFYATKARSFLTLDADVLCIGEGEVRLPELVRRIRDGRPLLDLPGLYLRGADGRLVSTGDAPPLRLEMLPPPDWSIAEKIDPPVDLNRDLLEMGAETQRGCVFKCEFCTFRTLSPPSELSAEAAAKRLLHMSAARHGFVNLVDATATFPHDRWERMMEMLAERGGTPGPMWAFARVSDINDRRAALMARAGVRALFIGQESGDQRLLQAMKKGTHVSQVAPAIDALGRYGLSAIFGFMHGFPGETPESIAATRRMLRTLNAGHAAKPVALIYLLYPFLYMELASVSRRENWRNVDHYLGYDGAAMTPQAVVEEVLGTVLELSRVPHAPVFAYLFQFGPPTSGITLCASPRRYEMHRWMKAVERGVALFVERDLEGRPLRDLELRQVRDEVLARYPSQNRWRCHWEKTKARYRALIANRLRGEWIHERAGHPGWLTRLLTALSAYGDLGDLSSARRAWSTTTYKTSDRTNDRRPTAAILPADPHAIDRLADALVAQALKPRRGRV
jgi:hypothetical protein